MAVSGQTYTRKIDYHIAKAGSDGQMLHEAMRVHSFEAGCTRVKGCGLPNDMFVRIGNDPPFVAVHGDALMNLVDPTLFVGWAVKQTMEF